MKVGVLFSGGKDSVYAAWLAKEEGYKVSCLITVISENKESYMFHTPFIEKVSLPAKEMGIPLIIVKTKGEKEHELVDLEDAIKLAIKDYKIEGVVTGAIESVYQATRVQNICNKLKIECFNPLWQKNSEEHWKDLLKNNFKVILVSAAADGLGEEWTRKVIDEKKLDELIRLSEKYKFHLAFEGGEAETFVINCPLFKHEVKI